MSFFGTNQRPDLKAGVESNDRFARAADTRYPEVGGEAADLAAPSFVGDTRPAPNSGPTPPERCTNIIAAGARWKGTLKVEDSVRVDGHFSGEIDTKGTVHVAEGAEMDAKIHAAFVVVSGNFKGEIRADQRTELMPRGKVAGEIITKVLSVHEGATFDGSVQMSSEGAGRLSAKGRNGAESEAPERRNGRAETPAATE